MDFAELFENAVKASFYLAGFFSLFLGIGWTLTDLPGNSAVRNIHSAIPLPGGLLTALTLLGGLTLVLGIYNYRENEDSIFGKIVGMIAELIASAA